MRQGKGKCAAWEGIAQKQISVDDLDFQIQAVPPMLVRDCIKSKVFYRPVRIVQALHKLFPVFLQAGFCLFQGQPDLFLDLL